MAITLDYILALKTKEAERNAKLTKEEVRKLKEELEQTRREARQTETQMRRTAGSFTRLGRVAGSVGSSMGRMSGVLGRLSPGLAEAALMTNDLADATELMTGASVSLMRILGPVAVAVGALAGAYLVLKKDLDAAEEAQRQAAERASDMAEVHLKVKDAILLRKLAEGEITQEQFNQIAAARTAEDLFRAQKKAAEERIETLRAEKAALEARKQTIEDTARAAQQAQLYAGDDLPGGGFGGGVVSRAGAQTQTESAVQTAQDVTANIQQYEVQLKAAETALSILNTAEEKHANTLTRTANAEATAGAAAEETTRYIEVQTDKVKELTDALDDMQGAAAAAFSPEELAKIEAALDEFAASAFKELDLPRIASGVGTVSGSLTSPLSMLGLAGPYGQAASAALGGLAQLGGMSTDDLREAFGGVGEDIVKGIERLPELLVTIIPQFILEFVPAFSGALGEMLRMLIVEIGKVIGEAIRGPEVTGDMTLTEANKAGKGFIGRTLDEFFEGLLGTTGEINFSGSQSRASGGLIPRDGLYLLHKNEEVVRSNRIGSQGSMRGGMSKVMLQMQSPGLYPLLRNIEITEGPGGLWEPYGVNANG